MRPSGDDKTWRKLLPKPPIFDNASRENEIAGWKKWPWTFEPYMASIVTKFTDDVQQVRTDPSKVVGPPDFSDGERQTFSVRHAIFSSSSKRFAGGETGGWIKWV